MTTTHLLEADAITKYYGNIVALKGISTYVNAGEVTCILGDNGAGKSSFIKILSGVHQADDGSLLVDGEAVAFTSPRDARAKGIATVYQDLAMVPLMSVWRNFFLGAEPRKGLGPLQWVDAAKAKSIVRRELGEMGIDIRDPDQPVGTLSGGERQSVAIARAVYFGARVLILDEQAPLVLLVDAGEDLDQARLARPVVAQDAGHLARVDVQRDVAQRDDVAVVLREPFACEEVRVGAHRTVCARRRTSMLRITARKRIAPWKV